MNNGHDLERARDALNALDPSMPREDWHRIGRSAIAAGLNVDDLDAWSSSAPNYKGTSDVQSAFRTITPEGGTSAGTLFFEAKQAGWREESNYARKPPTLPPQRPQEAPPSPRPGMGAIEAWERCKPAPETHPYIEAKRGNATGLRVVPDTDPLTIAGLSVAGWLVVPMMPVDGSSGEPVSLQFIPPPGEGKKLNLPCAPVAGVFTVGEMLPGGTTYVCEGIGQAWACWTATGHAAVVCFGWCRVRGVSNDLRQRDASARLVLVPDVGKEQEAATISAEVSAAVASMPSGEAQNFDANDYAQREGLDALKVLLASASEPPRPQHRFKLLRGDDIHAQPPLSWLIRGVLPTHGLAVVYGPSTSGKSFLSLDMAAHIAEGSNWFGYRVTAAPVVYVVLEAEAGIRVRAEAWEKANGRKLPGALRLVLQGFKLTEDVPDLAAAIRDAVGDGAVVFIDTLNRAAPLADENSSRDMGAILEGAKELQRLLCGLVVLVHHSGKDASRGMRGHSSLYATLDAAIEVSRSGEHRAWKKEKVKDGKDGEVHPFSLEVVDLAPDEEGEPVSSCVVRASNAAHDTPRAKQQPTGSNQKIILAALRPMFEASSVFGKAGAPPQRPCLELEAAISETASHLTCKSDRRVERTRQVITGLVGSGLLGCNEGFLWLP